MSILRRICSSYELVLLIGISLLAGVISYHSPITYTESDPLGSLLTAQSIAKTGSIKLDEYVVPLGLQVGFEVIGIVVNLQEFTKTANIWGVGNNSFGTNTNRIVLFQKPV